MQKVHHNLGIIFQVEMRGVRGRGEQRDVDMLSTVEGNLHICDNVARGYTEVLQRPTFILSLLWRVSSPKGK
jgi:hypothetical protein